MLERECDVREAHQIYSQPTTRLQRLNNVLRPLEFPVHDSIVSPLPVSYVSTDQAPLHAQDQNHLDDDVLSIKYSKVVIQSMYVDSTDENMILTNFENAIAVDEQIS